MADSDIATVIIRLGALHEDVSDLKATMKDLAQAVQRLAIVEERQSHTNETLARAFGAIDSLAGRVSVLETAKPISDQAARWVFAALWAAAGTGAAVVLTRALGAAAVLA